MALSKLEMQQMLREMGVKISADTTYEELKQLLQQENHSLWLKSIDENRSGASDQKRVVVRKRRRKPSPEPAPTEAAAPETDKKLSERNTRKGASDDRHHLADRSHQPRSIEKPAAGKPWKPAADGTEPFNRTRHVFDSVLKRAKGCCERCGQQASPDQPDSKLQPHYIQSLSEGGEHSIKNMVALCPACAENLAADPSAKDLKELKRKTRSRLYGRLEVVHKKRTAKRHYSPSR